MSTVLGMVWRRAFRQGRRVGVGAFAFLSLACACFTTQLTPATATSRYRVCFVSLWRTQPFNVFLVSIVVTSVSHAFCQAPWLFWRPLRRR